jgi:hypothetical protein
MTAWDVKAPVTTFPDPCSLKTRPPDLPEMVQLQASVALYVATPFGCTVIVAANA